MHYKGDISKARPAKKKRHSRKRIFFLLSFILLIAVLFCGSRFLGFFQALQNRAEWAQNLRSASQAAGVNYLLYGLRENNGEIAIEEMFFLNFIESDDSFHTIFIPGDILLHRQNEMHEPREAVPGEENGEKELRPFYTPAHFYHEGGAELLIKQISFFLDIPVHHYVEMNYDGIPPLVDAQGGMQYKGYLLKGQDYLEYFLKGENDEEPQEKALRRVFSLGEIVKFLGEKKGIINLTQTVKAAAPYFKTDLTWKELKAFYGNLEPLFDPQNLVVQLPGTWRDVNGDSFFEPNYAQLALVMQNLGESFILPREQITVQVLNGSGVAGVASTVGQLLEEAGFQVVKIDNADSFDYQHSQVISHMDSIEPAREIAVLVPGAEFFKETMPEQPVMVTVIIGKNLPL